MTHFLGRLIERARGIAPRVEPIVAPVFAPPAQAEIGAETEVPTGQIAATPVSTPVVRQERESAAISAPPQNSLGVMRETLLLPREVLQKTSTPIVRRNLTGSRQMAPDQSETPLLPSRRRPDRRSARSENFPAAKKTSASPNESSFERPIVRVTIGRIEVHAPTAVAAPARKTRAQNPPRLTLDAYLKERKEGAR
jgi:hypothetical protein